MFWCLRNRLKGFSSKSYVIVENIVKNSKKKYLTLYLSSQTKQKHSFPLLREKNVEKAQWYITSVLFCFLTSYLASKFFIGHRHPYSEK